MPNEPWFTNKLVTSSACRGCSMYKPSVRAVKATDENNKIHWINYIQCQHEKLCLELQTKLNDRKENA